MDPLKVYQYSNPGRLIFGLGAEFDVIVPVADDASVVSRVV